MSQRVVKMGHQLCLDIALTVELFAPAFCHILLHHLIVTSAFVLQHSHHAQHREFFFTLRRRGVQRFDQPVKQRGQVTLLQQLQIGLFHIRPDTSSLVQSHIGQTAAVAPVAIGQCGIAYRVQERQLQVAKVIFPLRRRHVHKGFGLLKHGDARLIVTVVIVMPAGDEQQCCHAACGRENRQAATGTYQPGAALCCQIRLCE